MIKGPDWSIFEAAILLEGYLEILEGRISRQQAVTDISRALRKMAINQGQEIDLLFRNENGISIQMYHMEATYLGREKVKPSAKVFSEIVDLYRVKPDQYKEVLSTANMMVNGIQSNANRFKEWLCNNNPQMSWDSTAHNLSIAEEYCTKKLLLKTPLLETTDVAIVRRVFNAIESDKLFKVAYKNQKNEIHKAVSLYYRYVKSLSAEGSSQQRSDAVNHSLHDEFYIEKTPVKLSDTILEYFNRVQSQFTELKITNVSATGVAYKRAVYIFPKDLPRRGNVYIEIWLVPHNASFDLYIKRALLTDEEYAESSENWGKTTQTRGMINRSFKYREELIDYLLPKLEKIDKLIRESLNVNHANSNEELRHDDQTALINHASKTEKVSVEIGNASSAKRVDEETCGAGGVQADVDPLIDYLESFDLEFIDNRSKGGCLWIIGGLSIDHLLNPLRGAGVVLVHKLEGASATNGKEAYWTKSILTSSQNDILKKLPRPQKQSTCPSAKGQGMDDSANKDRELYEHHKTEYKLIQAKLFDLSQTSTSGISLSDLQDALNTGMDYFLSLNILSFAPWAEKRGTDLYGMQLYKYKGEPPFKSADDSSGNTPNPEPPRAFDEAYSKLVSDLSAFLMQNEAGVPKSDVFEHFARCKTSQIKRALESCHAVLVLKKYYHPNSISDYQEMADVLLEVISKQFAQNGNYTSAQLLYNEARPRLDDFFFYNNAFDSRQEVYDLAVHLFEQEKYKGNSFIFLNNMHIWKEEPDYPKDYHGLLIKYGREHGNVFSREEAMAYFLQIGSQSPSATFSNVLFTTGSRSFLQYAENQFVLTEAVQINENFLTTVSAQINNLLDGEDYIATGEIDDFFYTILPNLPSGICWSALLLEDVLRIYETGFMTIQAGKDNDKKTVPAAIVRKKSHYRTFSDVVWNEISKSFPLPKEFTASEFREFLLNKGFIRGSEKMWNVHKTVAGDIRFYWTDNNGRVTIN